MSSRDKKDARKVAAEFQFEEVGTGRGRRGGGTTRERDREPPPGLQQPRPQAQAGPSTAAWPQPGATNGRRAAFGSSLTDGNAQQTVRPSPSGSSSPLIPDVDPAVAECVSRISSLLVLTTDS